jgi:hypothetical protein
MSSHYYHPATGELIDGDLRQARKVGGLPSPTTVLKILSSPGLKWYFRRQMWEATCTTPRHPRMSDEDHWNACQKWADEHGKTARDAGGDFHDLVQAFHRKPVRGWLMLSDNDPLRPQFDAYVDWYFRNVKRTIMVEQSVIGQGYAGRVDHLAEMMDSRIACLDAKTQDTKGKPFTFYPEWAVQLGAYAGAIRPIPDCLISVALNRNPAAPIMVEHWEWPKRPSYYHDIFLGLLSYWRFANNYFA